MKDATNTLTGKDVPALGASQATFAEHYICPVCDKAVILAAIDSDYQVPHFRHRVGEDHEACERYRQNYGGGQIPFADRDQLTRVPTLVCGSGTKDRVYFGIRYLLKKKARELTIEQGGKTTRQQINDNAPIAWIKEPVASYKLCIHYSDGTSRTLLVDGLQRGLHIFNASSSLGVRVPLKHQLRPGNYYLLYQNELKLPSEFRVEKAEFLHPEAFRNWNISKFEIPSQVSVQGRTQFLALTNYCLAPKTVDYALIQPSATYNLGNDEWQVESGKDWSVLIKFPHDHPEMADIYIQRRTLGVHYEVKEIRHKISETDGYVLIQGTAAEATEGTLYRIALKRNSTPVLVAELSCVSTILEPKCDRLGFIFDGKRVLWSAHELPRYLSQVRQGKMNLTKIEIPDGVSLVGRADGKQRTILSGCDFIALGKLTRGAISLQAEGHGKSDKDRVGIISIKGVALKPLSLINNPSSCIPKGEARRAEGFKRGQVSEYAGGV